MDLQTVFYTLGIIFYVLSIFLLLGITIGVFFVYRKINQMYTEIDKKLDSFKRLTNNPSELAASVGAAITSTAIRKIGDLIGKKRRK